MSILNNEYYPLSFAGFHLLLAIHFLAKYKQLNGTVQWGIPPEISSANSLMQRFSLFTSNSCTAVYLERIYKQMTDFCQTF